MFPIIKSAIDNGLISISKIADLLETSESSVKSKLSGNEVFDINEAMTINNELFPDIPFKELFGNDVYC